MTTYEDSFSNVTQINKLIKNTYLALSISLVISTISSYLTLDLEMSLGILIIGFISMLVLMFAISYNKQSITGLFLLFVFTALMGAFIGPTVGMYLELPNGPELVGYALGSTAMIFFGLSYYALTTKNDFSFMGGFLMTGLIVLIVAMIANIFLQLALMQIVISSVAILIFSGYILYDTSQMVHDSEGNYIEMTLSLYLDIINLFLHLLRILGIFSAED